MLNENIHACVEKVCVQNIRECRNASNRNYMARESFEVVTYFMKIICNSQITNRRLNENAGVIFQVSTLLTYRRGIILCLIALIITIITSLTILTLVTYKLPCCLYYNSI